MKKEIGGGTEKLHCNRRLGGSSVGVQPTQPLLAEMKVLAVALFVLFTVMAIQAAPAKKKTQPKCDLVCAANYDPVCGALPNDKSVKPKLFGNQCVLQSYNCENNQNFQPVSADQCKGVGGVRLS